LSEKEFNSYKRVHNYSNPSEAEEGKIKKEKQNYAKLNKKTKDLTRSRLRNIKDLADYDESFGEELEEKNFKAKKERGNLNTHKKRFKKLDKYEDFD